MKLLTITEGDLPLIRSLKSDSRVMEHLGGVHTEQEIVRSLTSMLEASEQGGWCFKIVPQGGDDAAGLVVIWKTAWEGKPIHEIGWMVLPKFQGRGLASQAVRTLLDRARVQQAFATIDAFPHIDNVASNRICEKNGFVNLEICEIEYAGRKLKCNHWRVGLESKTV